MWIWVGRWVKTGGRAEEARASAEGIKKHWEEVCLDEGLDPAKNVVMAEGEKMFAVGISEQLDMLFREEGGSWQYY